MRAAIREVTNALTPSAITTRAEIGTHEFFDLVRAEPKEAADMVKADMVAQGHGDHFANARFI
jgi:hypothetical protein